MLQKRLVLHQAVSNAYRCLLGRILRLWFLLLLLLLDSLDRVQFSVPIRSNVYRSFFLHNSIGTMYEVVLIQLILSNGFDILIL